MTGAPKGTDLELVHDGAVVAHVPATAHGSLIFRKVPVGTGYRVAAGSGSVVVASKPLTVTSWTDAAARVGVRGAEDRRRVRLPAHTATARCCR